MESLYAGTPLQDSKKQIRLLRWNPFDPQSHEDAVYSMEVVDCDENLPNYTAISYTWGDPFPTLPIFVNGHKFRIRVQCWYALWQLRYHGYTQNIWIDSISINQQDDVEKSAQVTMMGDIYEMANSVSACISVSDVLSKAIPFTNRGQRANSEIDTRSTEVISRTIEDLGALPYFDRLWIKQEIILARKVYLLNGMVQLDLDDLQEAANAIIQHQPTTTKEATKSSHKFPIIQEQLTTTKEATESSNNFTKLLQHRSTSRSIDHNITATELTLIELIVRYGQAQCTDPKDRVYGLLSLLPKNDPARLGITVDYRQSKVALFSQVFRASCHPPDPMMMVKLYPNFISLINWLEIGAGDLMADLEARAQPLGEAQRLKKATSNDFFQFELRFLDCLLLDDKEPENWLRRNAVLRLSGPTQGIDWGVLSTATSPEDVAQQLGIKNLLSQTRIFPNFPRRIKTIKMLRSYITESFTFFGLIPGPKKPPTEYFLVPESIERGDFIATVYWLGRNTGKHFFPRTISYAVLRERGDTSTFDLKAWAIPLEPGRTTCTLSASVAASGPSFSSGRDLTMKIHREDAIAFFVQNSEGLSSLVYPATTPHFDSHALLKDEARRNFNKWKEFMAEVAAKRSRSQGPKPPFRSVFPSALSKQGDTEDMESSS